MKKITLEIKDIERFAMVDPNIEHNEIPESAVTYVRKTLRKGIIKSLALKKKNEMWKSWLQKSSNSKPKSKNKKILQYQLQTIKKEQLLKKDH